jgi:hypothetical protein
MNVTGMLIPSSSNICPIPSFLPIIPDILREKKSAQNQNRQDIFEKIGEKVKQKITVIKQQEFLRIFWRKNG